MISPQTAENILLEYYAIDGTAERLDGYVDFNFKIKAENKSYILKISDNKEFSLLIAQNKLLKYIDKNGQYPLPVESKNGDDLLQIDLEGILSEVDKLQHLIQLLHTYHVSLFLTDNPIRQLNFDPVASLQ